MCERERTVSERYWHDFEKIALDFVTSRFKLKPDVIVHTREVKDGGVDGLVLHRLTHGDMLDLHHYTMVEAKLRNRRQKIGLPVFAASIIVAFNSAAQVFIVVTNQSFSDEALKQAVHFKSKTNMQVNLVNGYTLSGWVRRNYRKLVGRFPVELLDFLLTNSPEAEGHRLVKIVDTGSDPFAAGGPGVRIPKSGSIEMGWRSDGTMAPCEILIETERVAEAADRPGLSQLALIGPERQRTRERLTRALRQGAGVATLCGTAGVGKSVLVEHVSYELEQMEFPTAILDLGGTITTRQLFLRIFAALSGVDPVLVFRNASGEAGIRQVLSYAAGTPVARDMQEALLTVMKSSLNDYQSYRDLNVQLLLDFLERVIRPHACRRRPVLIFRDLNRTSKETLEFLHATTDRLAQAGVTVLLEIRDSGGRTAISMAEWIQYVNLFRQQSTLGEFRVDPLSPDEADEYLSERLPGLGKARIEFIRNRVGTVPLFLHSTAKWLRQEGIVGSTRGGALLILELERFFTGISPDNCTPILDHLIEAWWECPAEPYADCLTAAALMEGRLDARVLSFVCSPHDHNSLLERLQQTGIFVSDLMNPSQLSVIHDLMLERLEAFCIQRRPRRAEIAALILPHVRDLFPDPSRCELKTIDLQAAASRWNEVYPRARIAGKRLAQEHEWAQSSRYFSFALDATQHMGDHEEKSLSMIRTLTQLLEVETLRYRTGIEENLNRLDSLRTLVRLTPSLEQEKDANNVRLRYLLLEWRARYVREDLAAAMEAAITAKDFALRNLKDIDPELSGKALSNHAIMLKLLDRPTESMAAFDKAVEMVPKSITLRAERLSNIAAFALRDDPDRALACYIKLLRTVEGTDYSFLEVIHTHVDIAMAEFLRRAYRQAEEEATGALALAESNGVPAEEARALNILGCCYWAQGKVHEADHRFDRAAYASERTMSRRFLWRFRTNRAGTATELGKCEEALELARSAENLICYPRQANFETIRRDVGYITARWYVALVALARYYHNLHRSDDLGRLLGRVDLPFFDKHVDEVIQGKFPDDVFARTTHLHKGRIMITG